MQHRANARLRSRGFLNSWPRPHGCHCNLHGFIFLLDAVNLLTDVLQLSGMTHLLKFATHFGKLACAKKVTAYPEHVRGARQRIGVRTFGRPANGINWLSSEKWMAR